MDNKNVKKLENIKLRRELLLDDGCDFDFAFHLGVNIHLGMEMEIAAGWME